MMAALASKKTAASSAVRSGPASAFSLFRYMHKMKPADLSPSHDDLSSQDSSLENEDTTPRRRKSYCRKCDNCTSDHVQSATDSPRTEEQKNDNQTASSGGNNNNNSKPTYNNNNKNDGNEISSPRTQDPPNTTTTKKKSRRPSESGIDSPQDVDLMEVIRIPDVSNKRSIAEVLSQVVKLERSSSSSASELNQTPEAPDIVASTTKARETGNNKGGKNSVRGETRRADVATLVLLCQHYAQLVQALKEENYLLSCTQSPLMSATPKTSVRDLTRTCRSRSGKNVFTYDSEAVQNLDQNRISGLTEDKEIPRFSADHQRTISDIGMPNSPGIVKLHRSSSSSRDYYSKSPRQSPAKIQDDYAALNLKEKRHWNLKPLRNVTSKHKRDSKLHRKSSFSFFRESKENGNVEEENRNESPTPLSFQNPTVGVLSTKISEMESKIDELLKLEPVNDILRDSSLERSPARSTVVSGDTLRTSSKRGNFYRHSVREPHRDKRHQEVRDIEDANEDVYKRGGGMCLGNGGCHYQTLAQAAHVEVDKLRQLVNLLNTRLTEMSGRMLTAESKLREEQHRAAIMERTLERNNLDISEDGGSCRSSCRAPRSSSEGGVSRRHRPSVLAWGDASETLLRNKVEMAREEIELLRQHIDLLLRMRQEDLKVYESTVDKFRHTLASGSRW